MWIEMASVSSSKPSYAVILRVRMWIEMAPVVSAKAYTGRHPPCEDVDWNPKIQSKQVLSILSSSVWGCGLKWPATCRRVCRFHVILRVRMWIEINYVTEDGVDRNVILRVRMWIEMVKTTFDAGKLIRHPPCEDVDWNLLTDILLAAFDSSSSVWGCGLKYHHYLWHLWLLASSSVWGCGLKSLGY